MPITSWEQHVIPHKGNGSNNYIYTGSRGTYGNINTNNINGANVVVETINSDTIKANNGEFLYIQAQEGNILRLTGHDLEYDYGYISELKSDIIETGKLKADDIEAIKGWIETLNSREITTEYLTVTKQAHFFELIVDKIRSVGGQLIVTAANAVVDAAFAYDSSNNLIPEVNAGNISNVAYYNVWWRCTKENQKTDQTFLAGDQVLCQSFNNVKEGTNYNIGNKYYWRLCKDILPQSYVNLSTGSVINASNAGTQIEKNHYHIKLFNTYYLKDNEYGVEIQTGNGIEWVAKTPNITGVYTNVSWSDDQSLPSGTAVSGTFSSASKTYGLNILPKATGTNHLITSKLDFEIKHIIGDGTYKVPENINIGVYFEDDTFSIFNNVPIHPYAANDPESYMCHLDLGNPNMGIEAIVITSTNDVDWHLCYGMKLSNVYIKKSDQEPTKPADSSECDYMLNNGLDSIPGVGDNIVQLGYRPTSGVTVDETKRRQSAIIIAAYKSIDQGGMLNGVQIPAIETPSYAQYLGICDFNLYKWRQSYFDANGAKFIGDITLCSVGDTTLEDKIEEIVESAENDWIVPEKETLCARIYTAVANNSDRVRVECDLKYNIRDNSGIIAWDSPKIQQNEYNMVFTAFNAAKQAIGNAISMPNGAYSTNNASADYNLLHVLNAGTSAPEDYLALIDDPTYYNRCPMYIRVDFRKGTSVMESRVIPVTMEKGAVLKVNEDNIQSVVAQTLSTMDATIQEWSQVIQNAEGITSTVAQIQIGLNSANSEITQLKTKVQQTADQWSVEAIRAVLNDDGFKQEVARIAAQSGQITAEVIDAALQRTGIDITNGKIILDAFNTYVTGTLNISGDNGGFCVWDKNMQRSTQLLGRDLGVVNTFKWHGNYNNSSFKSGSKSSGSSFTVAFDPITLGKIYANESVDLNVFFKVEDTTGQYLLDSGPDRTITKLVMNIQVKDSNGNVVKSISNHTINTNEKSNTRTSNIIQSIYSTYGWHPSPFTIQTEGTYKVHATVTYYTQKNGVFDGKAACTYNAYMYVDSNAANQDKQMNTIGLDAVAFKGKQYDNSDFMWFGPMNFADRGSLGAGDSDYAFIVRNRTQNFRVSVNGVQRNILSVDNGSANNGDIIGLSGNGNTSLILNGKAGEYNSSWGNNGENYFCDIGSYIPTLSLNNAHLSNYVTNNICDLGKTKELSGRTLLILMYGFFVNNSTSTITFDLPLPERMPGKVLKFKGVRGGIKVKCSRSGTNKFIQQSSSNGSTRNEIDLSNNFVTFVSTGDYWCAENI